MKKVGIIGAGIGGISAALRLRKLGYEVTVFEKNPYVGGKLNQYDLNGYRWDTGPSVFTLPEYIEDLYRLYDKDPKDYFEYQRQDESCRYFFPDGKRLTFHDDRSALKQELASKLEVDPERVEQYLGKSKRKYELLKDIFLTHSIHKWRSLPLNKVMKTIAGSRHAHLTDSLNGHNKKHFKNPHLVQIYNRYATYNGSNPFEASAALSMISHIEQTIGTFFPKKGMRGIILGFYELAKENGVEFLLDQDVTECVQEGEGYRIHSSGKEYSFDRIVCAIDHLNFYKHILKDKEQYERYKQQERSTSAIIFYWGIKKKFPELGLHNIFFTKEYEQEFKLLFKQKEISLDPTIYVHISSKSNPSDAPEYGENWFTMINAPSDFAADEKKLAEIKTILLNKLEHYLGKNVRDQIEAEKIWTPMGIKADTGAYMGSIYGAAQNSRMSAITRHPNFSKRHKGIYFCGGTVHPGAGIPLAIQSAKIVERLMVSEG